MRSIISILLILTVAAIGCSKEKTEPEETAAVEEMAPEPDYIVVQHILIGFSGSVPGKPIKRTPEEAGTLAGELLERAQGGEDFDVLVAEFSDDGAPGMYRMMNFGKGGDIGNQIYPRDKMVPAFGDVGFPLDVGGIGLAPFDPQSSPYGWHIVKRIE